MNKKGFMFVETIVTLTILMGLLISFYAVFSNLLNRERTIAEYDKYSDYYALFYIKEIWKDAGYINGSTYKASSVRYDFSGSTHSGINYLNINDLIVLKCNNKNVLYSFDGVSYNRNSLKNYCTSDFLNYVESIKTCPSNSDFVLLGEFKTGSKYTYAHVYYPYYGEN